MYKEKSNEISDFKPLLLGKSCQGRNGSCLEYLLQWYSAFWQSSMMREAFLFGFRWFVVSRWARQPLKETVHLLIWAFLRNICLFGGCQQFLKHVGGNVALLVLVTGELFWECCALSSIVLEPLRCYRYTNWKIDAVQWYFVFPLSLKTTEPKGPVLLSTS